MVASIIMQSEGSVQPGLEAMPFLPANASSALAEYVLALWAIASESLFILTR
jgi:hypothetical protein